MVMPKKGRRQIVVGNQTHYYVVKPLIFGAGSDEGGSLTVEMPDGTYKSKQYQEAITPAMVEVFIKEDK